MLQFRVLPILKRLSDDISIAGYDGIDIAKILEPKLTTLCQDTAAIGRIAAEKLIDLIENPKTTLIDRFSVAVSYTHLTLPTTERV